jgi:hypothetical protein
LHCKYVNLKMETLPNKILNTIKKISLKAFLLVIFPFIVLSFLLISCKKDDSDKKTVVINELMPLNSTTATDQDGEYDDWIELYNNSDEAIDLSGYYLSDNDNDVTKWQFPEGTTIEGNGYLIIWADNDTLQTGLHACYKLSADGEEVVLSKPNKTVIDEVEFGGVTTEVSYSRIPNGTGSFSWQTPTFDCANVQTLK